jgi:hypothetical protein
MQLELRTVLMTVATSLVAAALAGCGTSHVGPAPKRSPVFADPQCPAVLAVIPARPPGTASAAATLSKELGTDLPARESVAEGSLLRSLAFNVGDDAFKLSFDMTGLTDNSSGDLVSYSSDVAELRQYCRG